MALNGTVYHKRQNFGVNLANCCYFTKLNFICQKSYISIVIKIIQLLTKIINVLFYAVNLVLLNRYVTFIV